MPGQPQRIQQLIEAPPIEVGGKVIEPVARLEGWQQTFGPGGAWAVARLLPVAVTVREGEQHYTIPLSDPTSNALRPLFLISGAVTLLCLFIMLLTTILTRRR
jgi:hypothetical protein